jgi:hypothetical protein
MERLFLGQFLHHKIGTAINQPWQTPANANLTEPNQFVGLTSVLAPLSFQVQILMFVRLSITTETKNLDDGVN